MEALISKMIEQFETGAITRRELVGGVAAVAATLAGISTSHAAEESTFKATGLNHIALNVTDVNRSRDFLTKHLGLTVSRQAGDNNCFLTCGDNFVALFRAQEAELNHFCFSITDYDVAEAEKTLDSENLSPRREGNRIYFEDPHGITVQLAAGEHRP